MRSLYNIPETEMRSTSIYGMRKYNLDKKHTISPTTKDSKSNYFYT
jgi:hypothetical protein